MKDVILGMDKIIDEPEPFPYDQFYDTRPLTDEALKDMGFALVNDHLETVWKLHEPYTELHPNGGSYLFIHSCGTAAIIKTVGSVKMLIEALKGDE